MKKMKGLCRSAFCHVLRLVLLSLLAVSFFAVNASGATWSYDSTLGSGPGSGPLQLDMPRGVATDGAGNIYVGDQSNQRIQKYGPSPLYPYLNTLGTTGVVGTGLYGFNFPWGVAADGLGYLYVADYGNQRIQVYDSSSLTYVCTLGASFPPGGMFCGNQGPNSFSWPTGVAADVWGRVYVANTGNNSVKIFDNSFVPLATLTGFSNPDGSTTDSLGRLYVADRGNNSVKIFDNSFAPLTTLTGFQGPTGVAVDGCNNLYVADTLNHRIQTYYCDPTTTTCAYLTTLGSGVAGSGNSDFDQPQAVSVDSSDNLYVADTGNYRIQKWAHKCDCVLPPSGMVGWWPLNEPNGVTLVRDISGAGNAGVPSGGAVGSAGSPNQIGLGKVKGAFALGYVDVPSSPTLNFGSGAAFSIDAWVKLNPVAGTIVQAIVSKYDNSLGIGYRLYAMNGVVYFALSSSSNPCMIATAQIGTGSWRHVTAVFDGVNLQVYVDGVASAAVGPFTGSLSNTSPLWIGGITGSSGSCGNLPSNYLVGEMALDEVEIFNRALTTPEIRSIYKAGSGGKCSFDFGDAPDNINKHYPSKLASNGARHTGPKDFYFGKNVNYEPDSNQVNKDLFDDGLVSTQPITIVVVNPSGTTRYVNILIDWNQDGDWNDASEWAVQNFAINASGTYTPNPSLNLPNNTWMRMTITDIPLSNYNGSWSVPFNGGETEDYIFKHKANLAAYHFYMHQGYVPVANDATVAGTVRSWPGGVWTAPSLQHAWSNCFTNWTTSTSAPWTFVKFNGSTIPYCNWCWFNVDFYWNAGTGNQSAAFFRWTLNGNYVGPWVWLGWRYASPPALYNAVDLPDGTQNTNDMIVRGVQFANSPTLIPNDETTLDNPEVSGLFAASSDPLREGPFTVTPGDLYEFEVDQSFVLEPVAGGRTLLVKGEIWVAAASEWMPFVVQFIAEPSGNVSPIVPAGAGVGQCGPDAFVTSNYGSTTTGFQVQDSSTFMGGLAGKIYIDWGDGSPMEIMRAGANSGFHTYANPGTYKIRKTTQDDQFGFSCWKEAEVKISDMMGTGWGTLSVTAATCAGYKVCSLTGTTCTSAADCETSLDGGDTIITPAQTCGPGIKDLNVYLKGTGANSKLQFHGTTEGGSVLIPEVANTMPAGVYTLSIYGPHGKTCYAAPTCNIPANPADILPTSVDIAATASLAVYCK